MSVGVPSLREMLARARRLGLQVYQPRATGEVVVRVPGRPSVRVNARRKDAPRRLLKLVLCAEREAD